MQETNRNECHCLSSPDGNVKITFGVKPGHVLYNPVPGCPTYSISYMGREIVLDSQMGLDMGGAPEFTSCLEIENVSTREYSEEWSPPYGELDCIPDAYREAVFRLREAVMPHRCLDLTFRAYNEGAAFRYTLPSQPGIEKATIAREFTHFCFPEGTSAYAEYRIEGEYEKVLVTDIKPHCEWPLTLELPDGLYACLTEADLYDYSRMQLSPGAIPRPGLRTDLHGPVHGELPFSSPWRVFIIGDRPGDLVEKNYLVLNLNAPCVMDDPSWIRPGKVLRVGLSTVDGKEGIDFAAEHGLQYILFDWGWYGGPTDTDVPDARFEDPHNPMSGEKLPGKGLNVKEVVEYGRDKGIGVWLYVNHQALERQMDELFPLYRRWGVAGVKAGFVKFGIQAWSKWHCDMIRKAAEHKLMVNIHDEYRPTGFARTYPNIVTQEGIRGNENSPGARHNTLLPFVRYPAGAGDYTPCYYTVADKGPERNTTCAHQLALPIVFYSPSMHCFWYDNPAAYRGEQEIELWESLPTTWNETRVLDAVIGEYVTVARRSGKDWYVGSLTNEDARSLEVPLDFLEPGVTYDALTCSDDPGADTRTQVKTEKIEVTAETIVRAELAARGGHAIRLKPRV